MKQETGRRGGRRPSPVTAGRGPSGLVVLGVAVVLLFAGVVGFGVYRSQHAKGPLLIPTGATATGVPLGKPDAPATIEVYLLLRHHLLTDWLPLPGGACRSAESWAGREPDCLGHDVSKGRRKGVMSARWVLGERSPAAARPVPSRCATASSIRVWACRYPAFRRGCWWRGCAWWSTSGAVAVGSLLFAVVLVRPRRSGELELDGYLATRRAGWAATVAAVAAWVLVAAWAADQSGRTVSEVFGGGLFTLSATLREPLAWAIRTARRSWPPTTRCWPGCPAPNATTEQRRAVAGCW